MYKDLINASLYIFEAVLFWRYCNSAFKVKKRDILSFLICLLSYGGLFFIFKLNLNYVNIIANIIVCFLIIHFWYKENYLISLIHATLILAFMTTAEYITIPAFAILFKGNFNTYLQSDLFYFFANLISKIIHLVLCVLFLRLYNKNKNQTEKKGFLLIFVISFSNMVLFLLIQFVTQSIEPNTKLYIIWMISALFLYISIYLVFYYRNYIIRQAEQINILNMEKQKRELDEQYFSVLEKSNDNMQILAHDFKNHLSYVRNLDNVEDIDSYIDKIYPDIEQFQQTAATGNKTLDVILSKYTSICELKAVSFKADVKNANLSQVESVDLISLLNNLLDNAVESAEQSETKTLSLALIKDTQYMDKLTIKNACDNEPEQSGEKLLTRKKDGALHGTGLKSVKKVCEKYGANYAWDYDSEKHIFTTTVLIPKEQ